MKRAVAGPLLGLLFVVPVACAAPGSGPGPAPRGVGSTSLEWAGLRYTFSLTPSPRDRIRVRAVVRNVGDGPGTWEVPWCVIWLRLYRHDRLVLDQGARRGCADAVRVLDLQAGEEEVFHGTLTAREVLPEGTDAASFLVRVYVPRGGELGVPRTEMEATLGDVVLRRSGGPASADAGDPDRIRRGTDPVTRT